MNVVVAAAAAAVAATRRNFVGDNNSLSLVCYYVCMSIVFMGKRSKTDCVRVLMTVATISMLMMIVLEISPSVAVRCRR